MIADRQSAPAVPVEVAAQYVGGALLGLLTWWLESDTPLPAEQLAPMFDRLVAPSVQAALGLPTQSARPRPPASAPPPAAGTRIP